VAVDLARVVLVFVGGDSGLGVGSGYVVGDRRVLTAAHVVTGAGLGVGDGVDVHLRGAQGWTPARVAWVDADLDAAVLEVDVAESWPVAEVAVLRWGRLVGGEPVAEVAVLRWGRLVGGEPVAAAAVGFPWAQERPDAVRDTDHVVGFVAPGAGIESGRLHLTVLSSPPADRGVGVSAWAGMSGRVWSWARTWSRWSWSTRPSTALTGWSQSP
jgi:Trypsin-like peptidase domain